MNDRSKADAPLSICVYCGSRAGDGPAFAAAAREVGTLIGQFGWQLVYGGGRAGLMGEVADAALAAGASVVGVIPQSLVMREHGHTGLSELHVVQTMHERKTMMATRSDAFLALPGGIGTMEELFEVWTWRQLGYHDKPVGLLNVQRYYDPLLAFIDRAAASGFVQPAQRMLLQVADLAAPLLKRLGEQARSAGAGDDYGRV
jgi:uncharacterized protein (TIGR00730 family)